MRMMRVAIAGVLVLLSATGVWAQARVPGVTDTEIVIGMTGPMSGPAATYGNLLLAQETWTVLAVPSDFYLQMGLDKVLSHQRLNGITAILAHIKRMAVNAIPPQE